MQYIIHCIYGVSLFLPLLIHFDDVITGSAECQNLPFFMNLAGQVIELVASVLDGNAANQQHMHLPSGLSISGFLLQSVSLQLLNFKNHSALKYMFR
jgi:hypothetical protein